MNTTANTNGTACCYHHEACEKRRARGLEPWCGDSSKIAVSSGKDAPGVFASYSEAVAASPVGRARWISGGSTTGSPARYKAEGFRG